MILNRRRLITSYALAASGVGSGGWANEERRRSLMLFYPDHPGYKMFIINEPGRYALTRDEIQGEMWGGGHSGPKSGGLLGINCGSVDLDFGGHTLGANYGLGGVRLTAKGNIEAYKRFVKDKDSWRATIPPQFTYGPASLDNSLVSLHNGTIDLARGQNTGSGVVFIDQWSAPGVQTAGRQLGCDRYGNLCPPAGIDYQPNNYQFEKLQVLSNQLALAAEGSHTVIRDCVIESAGTAAIFIAGPNVTIENCEIRLRSLVEGDYSYDRPSRAAIVLHDGSNAVIRNNRIRVDYGGMPSDTHCILVHDGPTNVVIEGNTFINVQGDPVTLSAGGETVMTNNRNERRWWP